MKDSTFKLRVPTNELEQWRDRAKREGKSVAEWIRSCCGLHAGDKGTTLEVSSGDEDSASELKSRKPGAKVCPHGLAVGWRCTLCGGIVK